MLDGTGPIIPEETVIRIEIPPQEYVNSFKKSFTDFELPESTELVLFGIGLSSILTVPSQVLYDGILASQVVSHIPILNVNLPQISMSFMKHLNKIVSLNTRDLYAFMDISFTETPAVNSSCYWMGYDSRNFLQNIGLISCLFAFIAIRQLVGLAVNLIATKSKSNHWLRTNGKLLASTGDVCSNMWLRFLLMTYFELILACFLGLNVKAFLPKDITLADQISILSQRFASVLVSIFPFVIILAICLKSSR